MKKKIVMALLTTTMTATIFSGCGASETANNNVVEVAEISPESEPSEAIENTVESNTEPTATPDAATEPTTIPDTTTKPATNNTESTEESIAADTAEPETTPASSETPEQGENRKTTEEPKAESLRQTPVAKAKEQYTYTDMDKTMWAKSSVNVRNLPSTDGSKVDSLKASEEVKVTGQCNETGWYRLEGNKYVSNNYLVDAKPVQQASQPSQPAQPTTPTTSVTTNQSTTYAPGTVIICQTYEEADALCEVGDTIEIAEDGTISVIKGGGADLISGNIQWQTAAAYEMLTLVNEDRANNGADALVWDSGLESIALERALEIASNFSHDGMRGCSGENIHAGSSTAEGANSSWINSSGHHANRINPGYTKYACAYSYDGYGGWCWVEIFLFGGGTVVEQDISQQQIASGEMEHVSSTDVGNGQTIDVYGTPGAVIEVTEDNWDDLGLESNPYEWDWE